MAILLTAVVAGLIQAIEHWFPWRMILGKDLPRISAYTLGVLGFALPLSALFSYWQFWSALAALWSVIVTSGCAVALAYGIDWLLDRVRQSYEHEEMDNVKAASDRE